MAPLRVPAHPDPARCASGCAPRSPANRLARLCFRERARARAASRAAPRTRSCRSRSRSPPRRADVRAHGARRGLAGRRRAARARSRRALASYLQSLGGRDRDGPPRSSASPSCRARASCCSTRRPTSSSRIAGDALPAGYRRRLARYRYGPGVFKLDWALDGPIPWRDPACREASTVHVGGTLEEICASERDMYRGRHTERPFLILCQQSEFDASRAPAGQAHRLRLLPRAARLDRRHDATRSSARSSASRRASATASSRATR